MWSCIASKASFPSLARPSSFFALVHSSLPGLSGDGVDGVAAMTALVYMSSKRKVLGGSWGCMCVE